jgi:hypothetical protein
VISVLGLAVVVSAGCAAAPVASAPSAASAPQGRVHGSITTSGGPAGTASRSVEGTVVVTTVNGEEVTRQQVAAGSEYSVSLTPGTYHFGVAGCESRALTVEPAGEQSLTLVCQRR